MKRLLSLILLLSAAAAFVSCGKLSGQFAYKTENMDAYRKMPDDMEFSSDRPVDWVFAVEGAYGVRRIYVIVQKKELVWAEVKKETAEIGKKSPWVHGRIEKLDPGEYKIVLAEKDTMVAEKPFVVYGPSDDEGDEE